MSDATAAKASVTSKVEAETVEDDAEDSDVEEVDNTKKTTLQFATEFMLAMIPTPDNLADVLSEKTVSIIRSVCCLFVLIVLFTG